MTYFKCCDGGIYIDHNKYLENIYSQTVTTDGSNYCSFLFHSKLFTLDNPYIKQTNTKKKKRKRKYQVIEETSSKQIPKLFKERLELSIETLGVVARENVEKSSNEKHANRTIEQFLPQQLKIEHLPFNPFETTTYLIVCKNESSKLMRFKDRQILIPKKCSFLQSDITHLSPLLKHCDENEKFSCVLLDPPWRNKSVKRGSKYCWLEFQNIKELPIVGLTQNKGIVAVWVTNKTAIMNFVVDELFPYWNVKLLGKWTWLKVTSQGDLIYPLDSCHKKPYELLVIGQKYEKFQTCSPCQTFEEKIFCSVPCKIHSHKPPIYKWLEELVTNNNPRCLEMFARNLTPHWTSWGNEVLMLQNVTYFENKTVL